jgi:phage gp46-like protein
MFQPTGGIRQCLWANEWALAARTLPTTSNEPSKYHSATQSMLEDWFLNHETNKPSRGEGWQRLEVVDTSLYSSLPALSNAGLLIDVSSICEFTANQKLRLVCDSAAATTHSVTARSIAHAIASWLLLTPGGRVIVLIDEANFFPAAISMAAVEVQGELYAVQAHTHTYMHTDANADTYDTVLPRTECNLPRLFVLCGVPLHQSCTRNIERRRMQITLQTIRICPLKSRPMSRICWHTASESVVAN